MNYDVLRRYVAYLEQNGFARVHSTGARGGDIVRVTREGRAVRDELGAWIARLMAEPFGAESATSARASASSRPRREPEG